MEQRLPDEPKGWRKLQAMAQKEHNPEKLAAILKRMNRLLTAHEKQSLGETKLSLRMCPREKAAVRDSRYSQSTACDPDHIGR
jgi:hypothetical protein